MKFKAKSLVRIVTKGIVLSTSTKANPDGKVFFDKVGLVLSQSETGLVIVLIDNAIMEWHPDHLKLVE